jgi:hypothetical protein
MLLHVCRELLTGDVRTLVHCGRGKKRVRFITVAASGAPDLRSSRMWDACEEGDGKILQRCLLLHRPRAPCASSPLRTAIEPAGAADDEAAQPRPQWREQSRGRDLSHLRGSRGCAARDVPPLQLKRPARRAGSCLAASTIRGHAGGYRRRLGRGRPTHRRTS